METVDLETLDPEDPRDSETRESLDLKKLTLEPRTWTLKSQSRLLG